MLNFFLGVLLGAASMLVVGEYLCQNKPVAVHAAREAYLAKVADGPKRDRLLIEISKLQAELDRQNQLFEDYKAGK